MMPMHRYGLALLLLVLPRLVFAGTDDVLSAIPQPAPKLAESTIIRSTGRSAPGNTNQSLACDVAENRAFLELKHGIANAQRIHLITPDELRHALPLDISFTWNSDRGICRVTLELVIPVQPKNSIPTVHGRQF
jgi:hypothetical protein